MAGRGSSRGPLVLVCALLLAGPGCRRDGRSAHADGGQEDGRAAGQDAGAEEGADAADEAEVRAGCGSEGLRFEDLAWVPVDARLVTLVELEGGLAEGGALDRALARLAELADDDAAALPVLASMDYANLELQLGAMATTLAVLGHSPAQLVEIQGPSGAPIWAWPSDCAIDRLAARLLSRWQLSLRLDLEHPGVRVGAGDPAGFPFDVIAIGERRVLLVGLGQGDAVVRWLDRAEGDPDAAPGATLLELEHAPIRSLLQGEWLLAGAAPASTSMGEGAAHHVRTIRIASEGVEIDGAPWPRFAPTSEGGTPRSP
ncbi:hypothetical protein G6O69_25890 [Pseudenhygromyxa sp. WMMC2535]|uniref:hypothetical protein n=1 Tax=Pseudenhygromyxa sp. WMMC2535 TaxID=2712867 RepID=UPI00155516E5|nr:hypothetical protein [Pseudenhygromyxa sp. WMMC2535]NVB41298.1 hypothetical protein [Pseudenhygromyxa sp. WMMC2535]